MVILLLKLLTLAVYEPRLVKLWFYDGCNSMREEIEGDLQMETIMSYYFTSSGVVIKLCLPIRLTNPSIYLPHYSEER
jgi:uncharacterized membrane protein